ncbi:MAG: DUF86 domain-containing protein [Leptolyngbyaceae cyanobacterium bins.302]|nr:DUF86 domain-containing protein [Leptolyngbyaceae cyanobacterium bins.302]
MFLDDSVRLQHMLQWSQSAVPFAQGKTREDLESDEMLVLSLVRCIEVVGEAASKITKVRQAQLPQISWTQVIGMRNRLVHGYFDVDLDIVWNTVTYNLPSLIVELEDIMGSEKQS